MSGAWRWGDERLWCRVIHVILSILITVLWVKQRVVGAGKGVVGAGTRRLLLLLLLWLLLLLCQL